MNRMNLAMKTKVILLLLTVICVNISALAQDMPTISPLVTYLNADGEEQQGTSVSESAPLEATFTSCTENADGWNAHYEWRFYKDGKRKVHISSGTMRPPRTLSLKPGHTMWSFMQPSLKAMIPYAIPMSIGHQKALP